MDGWFLVLSLGGGMLGALVYLSAAADDLMMGKADLDRRVTIAEKRRAELAEQREEAERVASRAKSHAEIETLPPDADADADATENAPAETTPTAD